jgi:hypothetical protein
MIRRAMVKAHTVSRSDMPPAIHRFVQHAHDHDSPPFDAILDAVTLRRCGAKTRPLFQSYSLLRVEQQLLHRRVQGARIAFGDLQPVRRQAITKYAVQIANRQTAQLEFQARPWRARPRAIMSSIVVSVRAKPAPHRSRPAISDACLHNPDRAASGRAHSRWCCCSAPRPHAFPPSSSAPREGRCSSVP